MKVSEPIWIGADFASKPDMLAIHIVSGAPKRPEARQPHWISPSMVIRIAAALYTIEENDLLSRRRNPRFEEARALVTWCLRAIPATPMSYPRIGRAMDFRDHSSIMNLHRKAIGLRLDDVFFAQCCLAMQRYFNAIDGGGHERP